MEFLEDNNKYEYKLSAVVQNELSMTTITRNYP